MERVRSPRWKQEFANLGKDPDRRRTAMNALRNYVRQLHDKAIPRFLSHLSELPDGHMSRQYSISLYEVIAREHGKNIIPHISKMMGNVLKVLSSNAPSSTLQQACAKAVSALARYTIDPSSFEGQREGIVRDLSNPLLGALLGKSETLAEGAAMCLQALVESEAWRFAPKDVVNEVCLRVTAALEEKGTQTVSHMKLVCSLANSNTLILEVYGRSLLKAAGQILETGAAHGNWQQRFCAVQMINSLLKHVHVYFLASEIPNTIQILGRCRSDRIPSVRNRVSETLEIVKAIASEISMSPIYISSSSGKEIPSEGEKSQRSGLGGSRDIPNDSYTYSPVSSLQSLNTKCQTPLVLSFDAWASRFPHFCAKQGPHSDSMDNVALSKKEGDSPFCAKQGPHSDSMDNVALSNKEGDSPFSTLSQMGESMTPSDEQEIDAKQANHPFSGDIAKYGECGGHMLQMSTLFENEGSRSISLKNDIVGGSDAEVPAQHESHGTSGGNFLLGHLETHRKATTVDNFDEHGESGDALFCQKEDFGRKPTYREVGNEEATPCLRPAYMEETAFTCQESGSLMRIDDVSTSLKPGRLVRSLQQQFSPDHMSGKNQVTKMQCTDFADVDHESSSEAEWRMNYNLISDDEVTGGNHGQVTVDLKGRMLLDNLDGVADECSDRSISQEGDPQESSSVWSDSVHGSESVSSTSSSTMFLETTDNQEDLQTTAVTKVDNGSPGENDGENKCPVTDFESVEGSTMSFGLKETNALCRGWTKAASFMETVLRRSLCAVLAIPAAMVAVEFFRMQDEYHVLVPT